MKLENRKKIWIHRTDCNELVICSNWGGGVKSFSKKDTSRIFECVKNAIQKEFPNMVINPWTDAPHGTME